MMLDDIILPDDLSWDDEITWTPIVQTVDRSATGKLLIQESSLIYGRPITLTGTPDTCWIKRSVALSLREKRNALGLIMTLTLGNEGSSQVYKVMFRQSETPLDLEHIRRGAIESFDNDSYYSINAIRLMEVI